jgi:hypothetical protein
VAHRLVMTKQVRDWLHALRSHGHSGHTVTRRLVAEAIDRLLGERPSLGRPLADRIAGSRLHNLKELRPGNTPGETGAPGRWRLPPPRRAPATPRPTQPAAAPARPTPALAAGPTAARPLQRPPPYVSPYAGPPRSSLPSPVPTGTNDRGRHALLRITAGARASFEPRRGESPTGRHLDLKPGHHRSRQAVKEPGPSDPLNATVTLATSAPSLQ